MASEAETNLGTSFKEGSDDLIEYAKLVRED
jgi:hypothetical protein